MVRSRFCEYETRRRSLIELNESTPILAWYSPMWARPYMVNPSLRKKSPHVPFETKFPVQECAAPHRTHTRARSASKTLQCQGPVQTQVLTDLVCDGVCEALVAYHQGWRHKRKPWVLHACIPTPTTGSHVRAIFSTGQARLDVTEIRNYTGHYTIIAWLYHGPNGPQSARLPHLQMGSRAA